MVNYFSFEVLKKKIWANFQRIIELFTKKIVKKLLKIWSWDPGSEIFCLDFVQEFAHCSLKRRVRNSTQGFGRNFVILSLNMTLSWLPC